MSLRRYMALAGLAVVVILYVWSATLPVIMFIDSANTGLMYDGWSLLLKGSRWSLRRYDVILWLPHVSLWFGMIVALFGRWGWSACAAIVALVIALSWKWVFYADLLSGYYAWLASIWLLAAVASAMVIGKRLAPESVAS